MLGRVGLTLESPEDLAATEEQFAQAKWDYMLAYKEHGASILRYVMFCAVSHGAGILLKATCSTVEKIQDREAGTRQQIYALHDAFINRSTTSEHASTSELASDKAIQRWREIMRRNRAMVTNPDGLVTLAERYLVTNALLQLEAEEAHLRTFNYKT
jgi:hypothetical protein